MSPDVLEVVFRVLMGVGTLIQTAFVLTYLRRPWRDSPVSRAVMHKSTAICAMLWALDHLWFLVTPPLAIWLPLSVWVTFTVGRQFWVLLRADRYSNGPYAASDVGH